MSATDAAITLVTFMKMEAPSGDVRLCDGGFLDFASDGVMERYEAVHPIFGTLLSPSEIDQGFGDLAEDGTITFAPNPDAALGDWFRSDLADSRIRVWMGELDGDGKTVSTAQLLTDLLVDTTGQDIAISGKRTLELGLISRIEKFFLVREGNVCSERFHKSVFPGEDGFNNCTDLTGYVAWGTASPTRGNVGGGVGGSGPQRNVDYD